MTDRLSDSELTMLHDSVRAFLAARGDCGWAELIEGLGLDAALADPRQGAAVAEEIGRARAALPLDRASMACWLLDRCGTPPVAATAIPAMAWFEPGMRYDIADTAMTAHRHGDGWRLDGSKSIVAWAPLCDHLIVTARTVGQPGACGGLSLFRIDRAAMAGIDTHAYRTIDDHPAADLIFADHALPADALIGPPGGAAALVEEARDRAMALAAAEAVGLLDVLLEQTIRYTGQRRQFGQPIADFQALQHRMVDMYLECELARSSAWLAAEAVDGDAASRARAVSSAMVNVARAGRFVGQQAIQLHGGMGMTDELAIGHYVKRLMAIEVEWGDTDWHLSRIAGFPTR